MSWKVLDPSEITDEDRRVMADLIEEERREREKQWWANYEADFYGGTDDEAI